MLAIHRRVVPRWFDPDQQAQIVKDILNALHQSAVVVRTQACRRADDPKIVDETRVYIRDFDRIAGNTGTADELYEQMLWLYPTGLTQAHSGVQPAEKG